mmetsp:Transcript_76096/g.143417  ORF Transcript_76096/g.143417 Transcript_76096/m.143417 type:complete len:140 (+) Transcript_76096:98-517(+)
MLLCLGGVTQRAELRPIAKICKIYLWSSKNLTKYLRAIRVGRICRRRTEPPKMWLQRIAKIDQNICPNGNWTKTGACGRAQEQVIAGGKCKNQEQQRQEEPRIHPFAKPPSLASFCSTVWENSTHRYFRRSHACNLRRT